MRSRDVGGSGVGVDREDDESLHSSQNQDRNTGPSRPVLFLSTNEEVLRKDLTLGLPDLSDVVSETPWKCKVLVSKYLRTPILTDPRTSVEKTWPMVTEN